MEELQSQNNNNAPMETNGRLKEIEVEVKYLGEQTARNIMDIGRLLNEARESFFEENSVGWNKWIEKNIGMSNRQVRRFIQVHKRFGGTMVPHKFSDIQKIAMLTELNDEDVKEILESEHKVGSNFKKVDELTRDELRQVVNEKKQLQQALEEREKTLKEVENKLSDKEKNSKEYIELELKKAREKALLEVQQERKKIELELKHEKDDILLKLNSLKIKENELEKKKQEVLSMGVRVDQKKNDLANIEKRIADTRDEFNRLTKEKNSLYNQIDSMKAINKFIANAREFQTNLAAFTTNTDFDRLLREKNIRENVISVLFDIMNISQEYIDNSKIKNNIIKVDWAESVGGING